MIEERLSRNQIISYALPAFGVGVMIVTLQVYLPKFYTDSLLVGPALLSWVFLFGRLWDAVTDPVMGQISDRTKTRWGRRRPYFLISALPLAVMFYLIWSPSQSLSERGIFFYLVFFYIAFYTFWTIFTIPYISLGAELTMQYHERTRLFGARQVFGVAGGAAGAFAPVLLTRFTGDDRSGYSMMGATFGMVTMALILIMFSRVRENLAFQTREPIPFFKGLKVTFRNRAFVILLIVLILNLGSHSFLTMMTPYVGQYVVHEPWVVPYLIFSVMAANFVSVYFWVRIAKKYGKKKTWTIAMCISAVAFLTLFITLSHGTWIRWLILTFIAGFGAGAARIMGPAISADVIDSDELETGRRREGAFFGIWNLLDKAAMGLAAFVGLRGLHVIGYVPNVDQTDTAIFGMKFMYCAIPALALAISIVVFQKFPITREVHARIRAELDARSAAKLGNLEVRD